MASKWRWFSSLVILLLLAFTDAARGEVMSIIKHKEAAKHHVTACNNKDNDLLTHHHHRPEVDNNARVRWPQTSKDANESYMSVLGDGGMKDKRVRVGLESWNFCNRVGEEGGLGMPSPRHADCADLVCGTPQQPATCEAAHLVKNADNELKSGQAFPQGDFVDYAEPDEYAVEKELYLASLCETSSFLGPWHFWMIMLKNGNFDVSSGMCPSTAPPPPSKAAPVTSAPAPAPSSRPFKSLHPQAAFPRDVSQFAQASNGVAHQHQESNTHNGAKNTILPSLVQNAHISTDTKDGAQKQHHIPQQHLTASKKSSFPCFGRGCMNHPRIFHNHSTVEGLKNANCSDAGCELENAPSLSGSFYGTYDLDDGLVNQSISADSSYFQVDWSKDPQSGTWLFHHVLRVNHKYPWLMLYLRADATQGFSGGYPWETRGMMIKVPESPNFIAKLTLDVLQGGGSASQFYLMDIGGCWKNDGSECNGDTSSDVTRYSEMIINPNTDNWCKPNALSMCPPYHVDAKTKERIHRTDTARFPYAAYHYYCVPPNARYAEQPHSVCDPYSNPQPQELMQLLPHPEWAVHGYPSTKGEGWIGDPRTWTLDVGGLSQRLFFYQDPNTTAAPRKWSSLDVGTEIYISQKPQTAEWIVSDFDVLSKDSNS
ncbi:hypothetical protein GOP47_0021831 [Adiantum capillus-veneris]|uniref:DUF7705 domain-containing protein n=1 Tax=Adiantum capillus-veneris TaxID=13818 RepID=A0A9D4U9Y5_ADICA|nr:hypothetical protein GOP47_0021831 [Adiantum capillus-veneris]